jgi:hypothetical protein
VRAGRVEHDAIHEADIHVLLEGAGRRLGTAWRGIDVESESVVARPEFSLQDQKRCLSHDGAHGRDELAPASALFDHIVPDDAPARLADEQVLVAGIWTGVEIQAEEAAEGAAMKRSLGPHEHAEVSSGRIVLVQREHKRPAEAGDGVLCGGARPFAARQQVLKGERAASDIVVVEDAGIEAALDPGAVPADAAVLAQQVGSDWRILKRIVRKNDGVGRRAGREDDAREHK